MRKAIVIGGSIGGMLFAKVLSEVFDSVTVIERNTLPREPRARKGVPQTNHAHVLLSKGLKVVDQLYPKTQEFLEERHAFKGDFGEVYWLQHKTWKKRTIAGTPTYFANRKDLEWAIRMQFLQIKNIETLENHKAVGLMSEGKRVIGVEVEEQDGRVKVLKADFIVDASGRGSKSKEWLEKLGYGKARIDTNDVGVQYSSRYYELPEGYEDIPSFIVSPDIPDGKQYGVFFNVGNSILLTLTGVLDEKVPTDEDGFNQFVNELEHDIIARILPYLKPMSEIYHFSYPRTQWIRYDRMKSFPENYLVVGDALCSFNPIYGQGMTVTAYEADIFRELLKKKIKTDRISKPFYKKVKPIVSLAWGLSSSDMLKYPDAPGKRTFMIRFMNWYMKQVMKASGSEYVNKKFLKVMTFLKSPATLFSPWFIFRLFLARLSGNYHPDFEAIVKRVETSRKPIDEKIIT